MSGGIGDGWGRRRRATGEVKDGQFGIFARFEDAVSI